MRKQETDIAFMNRVVCRGQKTTYLFYKDSPGLLSRSDYESSSQLFEPPLEWLTSVS